MSTEDYWYSTGENDGWWTGYTVWRVIVGVTVFIIVLLFVCTWLRRRRLQKWRRQHAIDPESLAYDNSPPPLYSYYPPPQPPLPQPQPQLQTPPVAHVVPPTPYYPVMSSPTPTAAHAAPGQQGSVAPIQMEPLSAGTTPANTSATGGVTVPPPPYEASKT